MPPRGPGRRPPSRCRSGRGRSTGRGSARARSARSRLRPADPLRGRAEHRAEPLVPRCASRNSRGMRSSACGHLVHVGLASEVVRRRGQSPIGALEERRLGRLIGAARWGSRTGCQAIPALMLVISQAVIVPPVGSAADVDHGGGPRYPPVNSSPRLQRTLTGRPAARETRGLERDGAGVLAAEATAGVRHDDAHLSFASSRAPPRARSARRTDLRPRPDGQPGAVPVGDRHAGLERDVGHVSGAVRRGAWTGRRNARSGSPILRGTTPPSPRPRSGGRGGVPRGRLPVPL